MTPKNVPQWHPGAGVRQWWRVFGYHLFRKPTLADLLMPVIGGVVAGLAMAVITR